ncbi:DUF3991 and toprim domain-containing protein [Bosea sp. (in: a-proteobacteria)]|uniref:DUF3991 and toprim domain-containing protein n=1 Tax=Bosea sp. (in: a-proteobacteria) TaxID=1871050 RepID=UPI002735704F|nr:DUF3991 and toprim domain-containing protein [Bosea sp. (in: a-proteobacteria)]MDP3411064.1 DUF3991 and toprim domain-containing protein [Bosea sp. (in: a-proteobacteria)]
MERTKVEELRGRVACGAVLEKAGFAIDLKESTRRAVKFRRGDAIVIVIHEGRGWFDPLSDAKGDVYTLVAHLDGVGFAECLDRVAELVGFVSSEPVWIRPGREHDVELAVAERWRRRRKPWPTSLTWRYLYDERGLPEAVLRAAIRHDRLREGPRGSMWAAHVDDAGMVTGWEERGPDWRGFATGGAKVLFRFGPLDARRVCVTEAAIDAMSLAGIEAMRPDSLFLSTGGGWAPSTEAAIRALAMRENTLLVAATDNNTQGEVYAARLMVIAAEASCSFVRLRPIAEDWNEDLRARAKRKEGEKGKPSCRMPADRVKGDASPAFRGP